LTYLNVTVETKLPCENQPLEHTDREKICSSLLETIHIR